MRTNYPIGGYKVDVAFPKQKVAIEVDGYGWKVLRFTWLDLTEHPQRVTAEIAAATRSPR